MGIDSETGSLSFTPSLSLYYSLPPTSPHEHTHTHTPRGRHRRMVSTCNRRGLRAKPPSLALDVGRSASELWDVNVRMSCSVTAPTPPHPQSWGLCQGTKLTRVRPSLGCRPPSHTIHHTSF